MHSGSISQFGHYLREKWLSPRRIRFWLLIFFIINILLGFFALPPVIEHYAKKIAQEDFDRELQVETVRTNPFNLTLRMDELSLLDIDEAPLLNIEQIHVDIAWSSLFSRGWTINSIRIESPVVHEERFSSGETRLMRLVQEAVEEDETEDEASELAFELKFFHIEDGELRFTDNLADHADNDAPNQVTLALQEIDFVLEDLSLNSDSRASVQFEGYLAGGGELTFDGELQMHPALALQGNLGAADIALTQIAPYLHHFLGLQLENGALFVNGKLYLDEQQPLAFDGDTRVNELRISQAPDDETLIGWQSLQAEEIALNLAERKVESGVIAVEGLTGRIIINEDQTTNFGELGDTPPANAEAGREDDEGLTDFSIIISGIELTDGAVYFADNSLPLPFSTNIHSLSGEVSTISSTSAEPARLALEGQVEDYGLAQAEGSLHVLQPTQRTTIQLTFRNLQIPQYSPYTVDFAGRKIAGGTMDADLEYTVDNEQLEGENNLIIRNIVLGEKVDSEGAMDLPLSLAIALLEDSDGVIDLTLPVAGDVTDPEFDFNAVIREALMQAFTSVVEAPFRFLANLVGAESEDLGQIEFQQGRTDLGPPQRERIIELREALNQRAALNLELAGPFSRDFDGQSIKHEKATEALRGRLTEIGRDDEEPGLTDEANQNAVEAMFTSHCPDSDLDAVRARFTEEPNGATETAEFDALAYRTYLAEQVIAAQPVADSELEAIGNARAAAVRDALADANEGKSIAADRIRIVQPIEVDSVDGERIVMEIGVTTD